MSGFWSPWNPYPIQAALGLRDVVNHYPREERTAASFDQRQVPQAFRFGDVYLERVLSSAGNRDGLGYFWSHENMRRAFGAAGVFATREFFAQEFCWNRAGWNFGGPPDRTPALWVEVNGPGRYFYNPGLRPDDIEGDAPYQVGMFYAPNQTATHEDPDTGQLARWVARDVNGDGTAWQAAEFDAGQWSIDWTDRKQSPFWMLAAGVGHPAAAYGAFQSAVTYRTWSLWQHTRTPWGGLDPFEHHDDPEGYPVYATDELKPGNEAHVLESPFVFAPNLRLYGRSAGASGAVELQPAWP